MRKLLNLIPAALLLFSCTPAAQSSSQQIVVDGFAIKPGQKWEIKAWGGEGWKDGLTFTVGSQYVPAGNVTNLGGVNFSLPRPDAGYPVPDLTFNWKSSFEKTRDMWVMCVIRDPKLATTEPPTFSGRWVVSNKGWKAFRMTGDITGTGACTVTLVQS